MYYVYEWFIVNTGEVIYVGKGTNNRYKVKKHNRLFNEMIKRFQCESRIIKEFESEEKAFEYEYERVKELKSKNQCVCNIYNGGFGGTTSWWDDDRKKWYSENNAMKSEAQRKRMSESNPMKNKEICQKVNSNKKRAVIIGNNEFSSVKDAMQYYGVSFDTIKNWCKKGINPKRELCRYADEEQNIYLEKRYNQGGCRKLSYKGKIYESPIDLSMELNVCNSTICMWAKRGFDPQGNVCKYLDDDRRLEFVPNRNKELHSKPIIVNGKRYPSRKVAEEELELKRGYLAPYIAGTRKNTKYICEYDNQQPSQTNTDDSSLEGSTTNE